jgi:prepilin-type N-terminal cleavage/methylation domain-containing protein
MNLLKDNKAFTLIELVIVIVIIIVLGSIAFNNFYSQDSKTPLPTRHDFKQEVAISIDGSVRMGTVIGAVNNNDVTINEVKVHD